MATQKRNLPVNKSGLKMKPQDLEDDFKAQKALEGKKPWKENKDIASFYEDYEDFENENLGLGCRKKIEISISPDLSFASFKSKKQKKRPVNIDRMAQSSVNRA